MGEFEKGGKGGESSGFTLLEVMVAITILAIALVAVYRLQAQTIAMSNAGRFYTFAPLLAHSKTAEYEIKPPEDLSSDSGDFGQAFPGYRWQVSVEDVESEELGSFAENLKRIDVAVDLNDGEFTYRFRTYRLIDAEGK